MTKIKRYGHLYEKIYDIDNLRLAHKNAQKGKGFYSEVIMINKDTDKYLLELQKILKHKTYKTSEYETFIKNDNGKEREIYKLPYFPDRICHWAIIQIVEPFFINKLNHCTHSAIPNRGIHSALKQVNDYMANDVAGTKYCLKMDIKKYYPSINHEKLKLVYRRMFKDADLLWLIDEIIDSSGDGVGVPIGNYLSQYSGNLYLYQFDRWLKEDLKVRYYTRYMDDITIFHSDKEYLHKLKLKIEGYLNNGLHLQVKGDWQVFPSRIRGVDFVGYRHFGNYILLRKSISKKLVRTMRNIEYKMNNGEVFNYTDYCSINSYKGWLKWANCFNLYTTWIKPLEKYCDKYYKEVIKCENIQAS